MFASEPSTSCPRSRARAAPPPPATPSLISRPWAATPPMKGPQMPSMWSFMDVSRGCSAGTADYRGVEREFGQPPHDRAQHAERDAHVERVPQDVRVDHQV